jgi:hypothetical protein
MSHNFSNDTINSTSLNEVHYWCPSVGAFRLITETCPGDLDVIC